jgi:hypothetical protein
MDLAILAQDPHRSTSLRDRNTSLEDSTVPRWTSRGGAVLAAKLKALTVALAEMVAISGNNVRT